MFSNFKFQIRQQLKTDSSRMLLQNKNSPRCVHPSWATGEHEHLAGALKSAYSMKLDCWISSKISRLLLSLIIIVVISCLSGIKK